MGELFVKDGAYGSAGSVKQYLIDLLKSVAIAFILTFAILVVAALFLCFTDFPEKYTLPSAIAATVLGVLAGSYRAARKNQDKRISSALMLAVAYILLAYLIGCLIQGKFMISSNTGIFAAIVIITAAIGGILAGRTGKGAGKYRGGSGIMPNRFKRGGTGYKLGKTG